MILILSYDWYEQGTDPVIDWLIYQKADFAKITINDLVNRTNDARININTGEIWINGVEISHKVNVIWFRRFEHDISFNFSKKTDDPILKQADSELQLEIRELMQFLFQRFKKKTWMPHYLGINTNKLDHIFLAKKRGIKMPETIICNNKTDLLSFDEQHQNGIIMKPIRHSGYFIKGEKTFSIYTNSVKKSFIETLPDYFTATLFQQKVDSKMEIRVFYIDGSFYATAIIITEVNKETDVKLSFGTDNINWIPYELPQNYKLHLTQFFEDLHLNTCSFDVILTHNDEYVLLDINPVGQYTAPSNKCNYKIEQKIANWLVEKDEKEIENHHIQQKDARRSSINV